jgi:MYXO-CTERM domain-containing protein
MGLRILRSFCWGTAALVLSSTAAANGRFPRAQRLLEDASDPERLVLSATYGLVVTKDRGATWHHVCEAAFGERDTEADALTALTSEGALLAGIYSRVSRAQESYCDFERTLGMSNREAVPDFALVPGQPGQVVAVLSSLLTNGALENQLVRSEDDGRTWSSVGDPLPESMRLVLTIDVAPSDETRIYLSGLGPDDEGVLLRSDDAGETFEAFEIPTDGASGEQPYIAAVAPDNPDALYVRTDLWAFDPVEGVANANDALLYSDDGGASFSELARAGAKLFGFTLSPDASEVLIGYADPKEIGRGRYVDPEALGILRAPTGSSDFVKTYAGSVTCLTWTGEGLYVCTHEVDTELTLGFTATTDFDLDAPPSFEPLLVLANVVGPIACEACSVGAVCESFWSSTCQGWGRTDCEAIDSGSCTGGANAGGESGAGAPSQGEGGADTANDRERYGCDCRSVPSDSRPGAWALIGLMAWLARRRR